MSKKNKTTSARDAKLAAARELGAMLAADEGLPAHGAAIALRSE